MGRPARGARAGKERDSDPQGTGRVAARAADPPGGFFPGSVSRTRDPRENRRAGRLACFSFLTRLRCFELRPAARTRCFRAPLTPRGWTVRFEPRQAA